MNNILLILFIMFFVISVVIYPLKMKGAIHINVLENLGFAVVKVFNIRLFNARFKMAKDGHVSMEKEKNKKKKKNKTLSQFYFMSLAKKVDVKKAEIFFVAGSSQDAFIVSVVNGFVNVVSTCVFTTLMNKYKSMKTLVCVEPDYEKEGLEITASGVISFSLFDMLLSVIYSVIHYLKVKERKVND